MRTKYFFPLLAALFFCADVFAGISTGPGGTLSGTDFAKTLLESTNSASARAALGIADTNVTVTLLPDNSTVKTNSNGQFFVTNSPALGGVDAASYAKLSSLQKQNVTPWATTGDVSSNAEPWIVYTTTIADTGTNSIFPSVCYDSPRKRLLAAYTASNSHVSTNGVIRMVESYDGGLSWVNDHAVDFFPTNAEISCGISLLKDGTLMAAVCARDAITFGSEDATNLVYQPVTFFVSDDGRSWSKRSSLPGTTNQPAANAVFQTDKGTLLYGVYKNIGQQSAYMFRSTDNGLTWNSQLLLSEGSEVSTVIERKDGTLIAIVRGVLSPEIFTSTDDGVTWTDVGAMDFTGSGAGWFASYDAATLMGDRLVICTRQLALGSSALFYSDDFPYTNNFTYFTVDPHFSFYDSPVNLSESVILWISSYDSTVNGLTSGRTNASLHAWVMANDAQGWSGISAVKPVSQPSIALFRGDIPANGRATVWPNWGTIPISPTNSADQGPISTYVDGTERMFYSRGQTNVHFGSSNLLSSIWQTGVGTFIWRSARTNGGDNRYVIDNDHESVSANRYGFSLKQFGGDIYFKICGTGTVSAATYGLGGAQPGDDYTSGTPHIFAVRVAGENAYAFADGTFVSSATNSTGDKGYSTASNSWQRLAIGSYANSTSGNELFLSDLLVFTNALTDAEIYDWMRRLDEGGNGGSAQVASSVAASYPLSVIQTNGYSTAPFTNNVYARIPFFTNSDGVTVYLTLSTNVP